MKKLFYLFMAMVMITACSDGRIQVEYDNGRVKWVDNPEDMRAVIGDSVIVRHYASMRALYSTDELYGYYRGVIPQPIFDSLYTMSYSKAIIIKTN